MDKDGLREIAERLNLDIDPERLSPSKVLNAIQFELSQNQPAMSAGKPPLGVRELVTVRDVPSGIWQANFTPVPLDVVGQIVSATVQPSDSATAEFENAPGLGPVRRMRVGADMARTKATTDYRRARVLPFAGMATLAAVIWGTRQAFGAQLTWVGTTVWAILAGAAAIVGVTLWATSRRAQRVDENTLRLLYEPDTQEQALSLLVISQVEKYPLMLDESEEDSTPAPLPPRPANIFTRNEYQRALAWVSKGVISPRRTLGDVLSEKVVDRNVYANKLRWPSEYLSKSEPEPRLGHHMSAVDLSSALVDAADLALERLLQLGAIEGVQFEFRSMFALTGTARRSR